MDSQNLWQLFLETGSPEIYMLYNSAKRMENVHVPDNKGTGITDLKLQ